MGKESLSDILLELALEQKKYEIAERIIKNSIDIFERGYREHPNDEFYIKKLSFIYHAYAEFLQNQEREEAQEYIEKGMKINPNLPGDVVKELLNKRPIFQGFILKR